MSLSPWKVKGTFETVHVLNTSARGQEHTLQKGLSHGVHDPLGLNGFSNKNFKHSIIYWQVREHLEESPSSYLKEHRRTGHFC